MGFVLGVLLGSGRCEESFGFGVVRLFGFGRGSVDELGMEALVALPPHPFLGCELGLRDVTNAPPQPAATQGFAPLKRSGAAPAVTDGVLSG